jgi:hypothetical protein
VHTNVLEEHIASIFIVSIVVKGPAADATDARISALRLLVQPYDEDDDDDDYFYPFPSNGAPVE